MKPRDKMKEREAALTHAELLTRVEYDPETGFFSRRKGHPGVRRNRSQLGHVESNGYRRIMINGWRYLAHRLVWFYVHAEWPDKDVDHRNLLRDDNSLKNLRLATFVQNRGNMGGWKHSISGLKGAHWNRFRGYWQSYITVNKKTRYLGRFKTAEAAHAAYVKAEKKLRGEFARAA